MTELTVQHQFSISSRTTETLAGGYCSYAQLFYFQEVRFTLIVRFVFRTGSVNPIPCDAMVCENQYQKLSNSHSFVAIGRELILHLASVIDRTLLI